MSFGKGTLTWKSYTINKALPITKQVQIIDLKEFVIATLDVDSETFMVYMAIWEWEKMAMNPVKEAQIKV